MGNNDNSPMKEVASGVTGGGPYLAQSDSFGAKR